MMRKVALTAILLLGTIASSADARQCVPVFYCDILVGCVRVGDYCCDFWGCYFEMK